MIQVPEPDSIDIFIHNHNILTRASWLAIFCAVCSVIGERYVLAVVLMGIAIFFRSMARLLCGWLHTWVALRAKNYEYP